MTSWSFPPSKEIPSEKKRLNTEKGIASELCRPLMKVTNTLPQSPRDRSKPLNRELDKIHQGQRERAAEITQTALRQWLASTKRPPHGPSHRSAQSFLRSPVPPFLISLERYFSYT